MITQCRAKIFLSGERGLTTEDWFRTYNTFHNGDFKNKHKSGFGKLYVLNEITLAAEREVCFLAEEDSFLVLLPLVGAITFTDSTGNDLIIEAGKAVMHTRLKGTTSKQEILLITSW